MTTHTVTPITQAIYDELATGSANWTRHEGQAQLARLADPAGDRFLMTGPSGTHSLLIAATDLDRLNVHWQMFASHPLNQPEPPLLAVAKAGALRSGTDGRGSIWHLTRVAVPNNAMEAPPALCGASPRLYWQAKSRPAAQATCPRCRNLAGLEKHPK